MSDGTMSTRCERDGAAAATAALRQHGHAQAAMRRLLAAAVALAAALFPRTAMAAPYHATDSELVGTAYAVLDTATGELDFVRSTETHDSGKPGTVKSVSGGTYTGTIYGGFEGDGGRRWGSDGVKAVRVVDAVRPTSLNSWFSGFSCTTMDLAKLDTSKATDMTAMFAGSSSLQSLDVSGFDTSNVTSMTAMFIGCSSLKSLDVSGFDVSKVTRMDGMFSGCSSLALVGGHGLMGNPYAVLDASTGTLYFVRSTETHSDGDGGTVKSISGGSFSGTIFTGFEGTTTVPWSSKSAGVKCVAFVDAIRPVSTSAWFHNMKDCGWMNLANLDTSDVTDMSGMFHYCSSMQSLDLSGFDTSKVTRMNGMFSECTKLESLDLSGFNTSKVTDMGELFSGCASLQSVDLTGFVTSYDTNINSMFSRCSSLNMITFGDNFTITNLQHPSFPTPTTTHSGHKSTGKWGRGSETETEFGITLTADQLGSNSGSGLSGTWYAQAAPSYYVQLIGYDGVTPDGPKVAGYPDFMFSLPSAPRTTPGTVFEYWSTGKDGTGARFQDGDHVLNLGKDGETVNLYAHSGPSHTTVTLDPQGGTNHLNGGTDQLTLTYGQTGFYVQQVPTREGYSFEGYYTGRDGTGTKVYGTGTDPDDHPGDSTVYMLANPSDGYWKLKGKTACDWQYVSQTLTLYANWVPNSYTVTYEDWCADASGNRKVKLGSTTRSKEYGTTVSGADLGTDTANGKYYSWYQYEDSTSVTVGTSGATVYRYFTSTADINLFYPDGGDQYAGTFSVSYDSGRTWTTGAINEPKYIGFHWGDTIWVKDIKPKVGFDLKDVTYGNVCASGNGTVVTPEDGVYKVTVTPTASVGYNAININTTYHDYQISYDLGGGSIGGQRASYTIADDPFTLPTPTRAGYSFAGWTGSNGSTPQTTVTIAKGSTGDRAYTANWTVNTYALTVDPNGGTWDGSTSASTVSQGYGTTRDIAAPTRPGFTFVGWAQTGPGTLAGATPDNAFSDNSWSGAVVYNNERNGVVTLSTEPASADNPLGAVTGHEGVYRNNGSIASSPELGGWCVPAIAYANSRHIVTFVASVPRGYFVHYASNNIGSGGYVRWLTPNSGTGTWQTYAYEVHAGSSGTFEYSGHVYLSKSKSAIWDSVTFDSQAMGALSVKVASMGVTDVTDGTAKAYAFGAGDGTLTALWAPNEHKATLDGQGATSAGTAAYWWFFGTTSTYNGSDCWYYTDESTVNVLGASSASYPNYQIDPPKRDGYSFAGYFTGKGGTGTQYVDADGHCVNDLYLRDSDVTLYAYWKPNSYYRDVNVLIDGKCAFWCGSWDRKPITGDYHSPGAYPLVRFDVYVDGKALYTGISDFYEKVTYGSNFELRNIVPAEGFVLDPTAATSDTVPAHESSFDIRLTQRAYGISYDLAGGSFGTQAAPSSYHVGDSPVTIPAPSFPHHVFLGWTGSNGTAPETDYGAYSGYVQYSVSSTWKGA